MVRLLMTRRRLYIFGLVSASRQYSACFVIFGSLALLVLCQLRKY